MADGAGKSAAKGPEAFRTISEASLELGVPQHVLRFWESKFSFIRPMKRAGGRRFYRRQDIEVLKGVRTLLHEEGYTIKGVQRLHKEQGMRRLVGAGEGEAPPPAASMQSPADVDMEPPDPELFDANEGEWEDEPAAIPAPAASDTAIIRHGARSRLQAVLRDLEGVKAEIDALLAHADD